ncbi:MAG: hypothetical protein AB1486_29235 [Planctomycetota bacterium]
MTAWSCAHLLPCRSIPRQGPGRRVSQCILLVVCGTLGGCLGPGELEWGPLFSRWETTGETTQVSAAIPIYERRQDPERLEWAIHPLVRRVRDSEGLAVQILSPLGDYREHENRRRFYFLPLFWYQAVDRPEGTPSAARGRGGGTDWDLLFLPLLAAGGGDGGEPYFALFPLAGKIRNFAAYDEVNFFLFPLYYSATKRVTDERVSRNITPLIGWTTGGPLHGSWHVYPFYGQSLWKGKYEKYSVVWPVFHYQRYALDTQHPATLVAFWPLFKRDVADNHSFWSLLWPFFRFNWEIPDTIDGLENVEGHDYVLYDAPWPLVRYVRERDKRHLRVLPLFSHYRSNQLASRAYLVPIFWWREERLRDAIKRDFYIVPFTHRSRTTYEDGRGQDAYLQIWPLAHIDSHADGQYDLATLSLVPLSVEKIVGDFSANWDVFWNLFRYTRDDRGAERISALLGLVRWYRDGYDSRFALSPLYAWRYRKGEGTLHQLLLGLVSWTGGEAGFSLRLFGLEVF